MNIEIVCSVDVSRNGYSVNIEQQFSSDRLK